METNAELTERARRGDAHAFAELYRECYEELYRFALYTLKNPHDAEDAVAEAVTDAYASIRKLRSAEKFRGWIFKILSNKCRRKLKEYANKTRELPEELCVGDFSPDSQLWEAFSHLTDEERLIISLHLFGGYNSRETGKLLRMNENTVRSKESRALKKMAKLLEEDA